MTLPTDTDHSMLKRLQLANQLMDLAEPRRAAVQAWFDAHWDAIASAPGSSSNHQTWPGGFLDHTLQLLQTAERLFATLPDIHPLPTGIDLDAAKTVLLFHDVEKPFKYTTGLPAGWDKQRYLTHDLAQHWGITFSSIEINALTYVHGEGDDYRKGVRVMNPLAAFVHSCDILSARVWFDRGAPGA